MNVKLVGGGGNLVVDFEFEGFVIFIGVIIRGVVGGVVGIVILVIVMWFFYCC